VQHQRLRHSMTNRSQLCTWRAHSTISGLMRFPCRGGALLALHGGTEQISSPGSREYSRSYPLQYSRTTEKMGGWISCAFFLISVSALTIVKKSSFVNEKTGAHARLRREEQRG
jgi:hypothetical protein